MASKARRPSIVRTHPRPGLLDRDETNHILGYLRGKYVCPLRLQSSLRQMLRVSAGVGTASSLLPSRRRGNAACCSQVKGVLNRFRMRRESAGGAVVVALSVICIAILVCFVLAVPAKLRGVRTAPAVVWSAPNGTDASPLSRRFRVGARPAGIRPGGFAPPGSPHGACEVARWRRSVGLRCSGSAPEIRRA